MIWPRFPTKRLADVLLGKMIQPEPMSASDVAAPYLRAAHVQPDGQIIEVDHKTMWFRRGELALHELRRGDVVIVEGGAGYGRSAVIRDNRDGWGFQNSIVRVRPKPEMAIGRYLDYAFQSALAAGEVEVACFTATLPHFTADKVTAFKIPRPPIDVQRAIADYLDHETAHIDTLINEQRRLIEMLRERRRAVIDESFSSFGDNGVQLRRYIEFLTSGSRGWGDYYADQGERFLRIGNLSRLSLAVRGEVQFVELPSGAQEGSRTMLQERDLLFSITAYLGSVAVVEADWVGAYVSQHVALCRLEHRQLDPRFIGWFMLTTRGQDQLNEGAAGGTKMQLALDDIRGLWVPTAPIEQQHRVAAHLDEETPKIDTLIAETETFIELARERRTALITAAVTGQIDVREMA